MKNEEKPSPHFTSHQTEEEFGKIVNSYYEQEQIASATNKLHNQKGYLMAKVRKEGKLYNVSSGVKVPDGLVWNPNLQFYK